MKNSIWLAVLYLIMSILLLISCTSVVVEDEEVVPNEEGVVLEIDSNPPIAKETIQYGQPYGDIELVSRNYNLEVIIPPSKTITAPFDSDVLPDGRIVMMGSRGKLVSVNLEGGIHETIYPGEGANFESDDSGTMWYYDFSSGMLAYWTTDMQEQKQVATLPAVYTEGSIAVSPDGTEVYIGWWQSDWDLNSHKSALYRYSEKKGLEKVIEGEFFDDLISAVEVTQKGTICIARNDGIYNLTNTNHLELIYSMDDMQVRSDGMTSDENDNLYFSAYGTTPGIYKLTTDGQLTNIVTIENEKELPFGLSWDYQHQLIIGVHKERGEIMAIDMEGNVTILNDPSGLITPIAVEEHPDGTIFVNGDEAGLLMIDRGGVVHSYCKDFLVSYQPPAADFCFTSDGIIYYTFAAPGFESMIVMVDQDGRVNEVTKDVGAPAGIEVSADGKIYYADYQKCAVFTLTDEGESIPIVNGIHHPVGLVIDSENNFWVGATAQDVQCNPLSVDDECFNTRIFRFKRGETPEEIYKSHEEKWSAITFFDVDAKGNLYIPDGNTLLLRTPDGIITEIANGFSHIRAARVVTDGRIYISDYGAGALYRLVALSE